MAIKRLHLPEGAPVWGPTNPHKVALRMWKERSSDIEILRAGNYDVTPIALKAKYPNSNQLTVMEDGTGLFRVFPVAGFAIKKMNMSGPGSQDELAEGRGVTTYFPQDQPGRLVIGDRPERANRGRLFLFDVILWSPDISDGAQELNTMASLDLTAELVNV